MAAPHEITPRQLQRLIGTPDCPPIVDICIDQDFADDPYLIPGSFRHTHQDVDGLIAKIGRGPVVVTCQKGKKLSQGLVAWLRSEGIPAEYLAGGMYGWRDTPDAPRIPAKTIPAPTDGSTVWVTRHRPKIDRIACPWLILRFVDPHARFLFVAPAEVHNVAEKFNATPFDVDDCALSHSNGNCTFDAMLDLFALRTETLDRMADVIRAADIGDHTNVAEAAGLLAISVGLSRQYKNDQDQLNAGLNIYDALYRWARDGFDEQHHHADGPTT